MASSTCSDTAEDEAKVISEYCELAEHLKSERQKYNRYKIIKDVSLECTKSSCELSTQLQSKVYNILMVAEVEQSLELTNKCALLGLDPTADFNLMDLTYEEKQLLRKAVEKRLVKRRHDLEKDLVELGISIEEDDSVCSRSALSLDSQDKMLMHYKNNLNEKQEEYVSKLQEYIDCLEDIISLKTKTLPEVASQKLQTCKVESDLIRLKAEIFSMKSRVNIFTETNSTLDAYREILKDIKKQQSEFKEETEKLKSLKERYQQVSSKEYNEILQNYLYYKSSVDKKKLLSEKLNNK